MVREHFSNILNHLNHCESNIPTTHLNTFIPISSPTPTGSGHQRAQDQDQLGAGEETAPAGRGLQWSPGGHPAGVEERTVPQSGRSPTKSTAAHRQQSAIANHGGDGVLIVDPSGCVLRF